MAINYTNLFTIVGKYTKSVNDLFALHSTIQSGSDDIETRLETANLTRLFSPIPAIYDGFKTNVVSWVSSVVGQCSILLQDRDYIIENLPLINVDLNSVLIEIFDDMVVQTEDVKPSVTTIGSITTTGTTTSGDLLIGTKLDGVSAPYSGAPIVPGYSNLESQLVKDSSVIYCECITAATDGTETFQLFSTGPATSAYQIQEEHPGVGSIIVVSNVGNLTGGGDFDTYTVADVPDSWTMTGTVTTDYGENTTSKFVFKGSSSLKVINTGVKAKQQITGLTRLKQYLYTLQVARDDTDVGTTDIVLTVENNDGSTVYATSTTTIAVPSSSSDVFIPVKLFFQLADTIDLADVYIAITVNNFVGTPTLPTYLDEAILNTPTYYNGVNFSVARGKGLFVVGDRFATTISNDNAGVFQKFFRKAYNIQLPTDGTPTISDTLAT